MSSNERSVVAIGFPTCGTDRQRRCEESDCANRPSEREAWTEGGLREETMASGRAREPEGREGRATDAAGTGTPAGSGKRSRVRWCEWGQGGRDEREKEREHEDGETKSLRGRGRTSHRPLFAISRIPQTHNGTTGKPEEHNLSAELDVCLAPNRRATREMQAVEQ